jgi:hypothetical protein
MFNRFKAGALVCAVLPMGFLMSGCALTDGMGAAGVREVQRGNWQAAKVEFNRDYAENPEHPIAVFNMGDTYHHDANLTDADAKFSHAAAIGKTYEPDLFLEPDSDGATIAMIACRHLHEDHRLDSNCGDQIALETPPSPVTPPAAVAVAPQAAPEPAQSEAQATIVPEQPRKQDRN